MNNAQTRHRNSPALVSHRIVVLKQHAHMIFLSSLFLSICGIVGVSLLPNVYRATTTILVDPQKIPEKYVSSTVTTDPNARMNTLTQQVLSASRLQEIIDKDNLYPELKKTKSREEILDFMRDKTKIELKQSPEPEQGLSSFSITYEDRDRMMVALITNQLASSFIDWNLRVRQLQALGTTQFLSSELQAAKESLEAQENQLASFKMRHAGATPDELNGNLQALSRLQADTQSNMDAISRLDQERILLTRTNSADPHAIPSSDRERVLQEKRRLENERWTLKRQFTDTYPDVIAVNQELKVINAKLATMAEPTQGSADAYDENTQVRLALIDKDMQRHKQQLADLGQQIHGYQSKIDSVPILETQLAELTRNYEASRQNYQSLLDKTFSAGMSEELERKQQAERFTVLDPARTPEKPFRPKRLPIMAGVLVASLLIPAGLVFWVDLLKGSITSEYEVREMLPPGIPIFGALPRIQSKADLGHARLLRVQTIIISLLACTALVVFLFKVRPIL
jgi:succinoglycan biosynthesis transport protein ExoP